MRLNNATQPERNRIFHEVMQPFSSIVIQPSGESLNKSYKLNQPIFMLRELPVKEQYKKAMRKINETLYPELLEARKKPEKTVSNMMISNKGEMLDLHK